MFLAQNGDVDQEIDNTTTIWAGASGANPNLGMVAVFVADTSRETIESSKGVTAPIAEGPVTITGFVAGNVLMSAPNGDTFAYVVGSDHIVRTGP